MPFIPTTDNPVFMLVLDLCYRPNIRLRINCGLSKPFRFGCGSLFFESCRRHRVKWSIHFGVVANNGSGSVDAFYSQTDPRVLNIKRKADGSRFGFDLLSALIHFYFFSCIFVRKSLVSNLVRIIPSLHVRMFQCSCLHV